MLYLYDSKNKQKKKFIPINPKEVNIYTCGPTVYNDAHVGNLRSFIFADLLQRWLKFGLKYNVKWVMNITDIDDKTINGANIKEYEEDKLKLLKTFTNIYTEKFFNDLEKLSIKKKSFYKTPFATECILEMQNLIKKIYNEGYAYIKNHSVYFNVRKFKENYKYGKLADLDFSEMQTSERGTFSEKNRDSFMDFVLWKGYKKNEPFWNLDILDNGENRILKGRPGWHIECSGMQKEFLPLPFDIHTGGIDLCFPHHENEIAQSLVGYKSEPANYWVHNEHLLVSGNKMSKSENNFFILSDLEKDGFTAEQVRFFMIIHHYRSKLNMSKESIISSSNQLKRIKNFIKISLNKSKKSIKNINSNFYEQFIEQFEKHLNNDLNTPLAIADFFAFVKNHSNLEVDNIDILRFESIVENIENVLGISFLPEKKIIPLSVMSTLENWKKARKNKDWETADSLRNIIIEKGFKDLL
jgi:cysteinyl-tRNA synthetase